MQWKELKYRVAHANKGFTLIEMLIVIAIIGILASGITLSYNSAREKSRIAKAKADLETIKKAIDLFGVDTGYKLNGLTYANCTAAGNGFGLTPTSDDPNVVYKAGDGFNEVLITDQPIDQILLDNARYVVNMPNGEPLIKNVAGKGPVETGGNWLNWNGPYISYFPTDPWGLPYLYDDDYVCQGQAWCGVNGGKAAVVASMGPDQRPGKNPLSKKDYYLSINPQGDYSSLTGAALAAQEVRYTSYFAGSQYSINSDDVILPICKP